MKKTLFVYALLLIATHASYCQAQKGDVKNDLAVYRCILYQDRNDSIKDLIDDSAYLIPLLDIDFKKEDPNKWYKDNKSEVIKNWKAFFDQIDARKLKVGKIQARRIGTYLVRHINMEELENDRSKRVCKFSPVIYSKQKSLAVCSVAYFGWGEYSDVVYLLQFKGKKWKIIAIMEGVKS